MHPEFTGQLALEHIQGFHSQARKAALTNEAQRSSLQVKAATPTFREKAGHLLVRWGMQLASERGSRVKQA